MTRAVLFYLVLLLAAPAARAQPQGKLPLARAPKAEPEAKKKRPKPMIPKDWNEAGAMATYDKKTVFKVINGAAELYISYGFSRLHVHKASKGELKLRLHVYTLGSPLDAMGVFLRERPEEASPLKITGAMAAFAAPAHCLAFGGATYLRVQISAGTLTRDTCYQLLSHAAGSFSTMQESPDELRLLPTKGRVPGTLGYTRESFLGLRELTHCLHARYGATGAKAKLIRFVMLARKDKHIAATLERLRKKKWKQHKQGSRLVWHRQVPYKGTVALTRSNGGFAGVAGVGTLKPTLKLLEPASLGKPPKPPGPPTSPKGK